MELNKCEMLAEYGAFINDEDALLFVIDGYFPGKPTDSVLYYNDGEDALLARSEGQVLMLDKLNEHVAESLKKATYVLVHENDSGQIYKADVSKKDVSDFIKKMYAERNYSAPILHPYPITTGAYELGKIVCDCCHKDATVYYREVGADGSEVTVCPNCVWNVPKYKTKRPESYFWPRHCNGKDTIYYGKLCYDDITKDMWREYLKNWNYEGNPHSRKDAARLKEGIADGSVEAHLFKCKECRAHLLYFIE